jgi:hypothetical protein
VRSRPAYAPGRRDSLLLHAALDPAPAALRAWSEAYDALGRDLDRADHEVRALLPLVHTNLREAGEGHEAMPQLRSLHRVSAFRNMRLLATVGGAVGRLADAGIDVIVFKGSALSALYYAHPADRMMGDVDILVRPGQAARAARLLESAGWVPKGPLSMALRHDHSLRLPPDTSLDLQWRPLHEPVPDDRFWDGAVAVSVGGLAARALNPADQLLVTCAHATYGDATGARWVADVAVIVRASGERLDWQRLTDGAEQLHLTTGVERVLRIARDEFGVPVPEAALARLARAPRPPFERVAHSVRARRPRRGALLAVHWSDYRRLRSMSPAAAADGLPRYLRDRAGSDSWRGLARAYGRAPRTRA